MVTMKEIGKTTVYWNMSSVVWEEKYDKTCNGKWKVRQKIKQKWSDTSKALTFKTRR